MRSSPAGSSGSQRSGGDRWYSRAHARTDAGYTTAGSPHASRCQSQSLVGTCPVTNSSCLPCSQCGPGRLPESGQIAAETMVAGRGGAVGSP